MIAIIKFYVRQLFHREREGKYLLFDDDDITRLQPPLVMMPNRSRALRERRLRFSKI